MFQARIELATLLKLCLSQLLGHVQLWLTVAQRKLFNVIPHNFEKRCKVGSLGELHNICQSWLDHQLWYSMPMVYNQMSDLPRLILELSKSSKFSHLALPSPSYFNLLSIYFILSHLNLSYPILILTFILSYLFIW